MKKKSYSLALAAAGILTLSLLGNSTYAYLTDNDKAVNKLVIGQVTIDLTEPHWTPDEHTALTPSSVIQKDPQITNTGNVDSYVYLEVSIPTSLLITVNSDGRRNEPSETELFSFTSSEDWILMDREAVDQTIRYRYAYHAILSPGETTTPLFTDMTFANLVEGQLDTLSLNVPIRAFAIQSAHTGDGAETEQDGALAAFQKFLNQNPEVSDSDSL